MMMMLMMMMMMMTARSLNIDGRAKLNSE